MKEFYKDIDDMIINIMEVNELSLTLVHAMKCCMTNNEDTYHLITIMEILNNKTNVLYQNAEELSMKYLQQNLCSYHETV